MGKGRGLRKRVYSGIGLPRVPLQEVARADLVESIDEPGKEQAELDRKESMREGGLVWKPDGDPGSGKERRCPSGGDLSSEVLSGSSRPDHRPCPSV